MNTFFEHGGILEIMWDTVPVVLEISKVLFPASILFAAACSLIYIPMKLVRK